MRSTFAAIGLMSLACFFAACTSLPPRSHDAWTPIEGRQWRAVSIGGEDVLPGSAITLIFGADGLVAGAAQNRFSAPYDVDGTSISIGDAAVTRMFIDEPPGAMDQEQRFLDALTGATRWSNTAGLTLSGPAGDIELVHAD